jgi:hypothetical protein
MTKDKNMIIKYENKRRVEMINIDREEFENARRDFFKERVVIHIGKIEWDEFENMTPKLNEIYQQLKGEIAGKFTFNEAMLIVSEFKGLFYEQELDDKRLLKVMIDSAIYELLDMYYEVDKDKLLEKVKTLNEYQCFAVIMMTIEYWCISYDINNDLKRLFGIC